MKITAWIIVAFFLSAGPLLAKTDPAGWCGTKGIQQTQYAIKLNEIAQRAREVQPLVPAEVHADVGEIAVIEATDNTLIQPNPFDIPGKKLSFTPNSKGGYDLKISNGVVAGSQGSAISLTDDDSESIDFKSGFSFPFYGTTHTSVFVNTDGNLTFVSNDSASTDRSVFRALDGPPRVFPFFTDLNPEDGGQVKVLQTGTRFRVTWNQVPAFGAPTTSNTIQVDLFKNGNIVMVMGKTIDTKDAVTGISPGETNPADSAFVDFSKGQALNGTDDAILERYASAKSLDLIGLVQEFHQTHPAIFDFVVIFSDRNYISLIAPGAFAFYLGTQNAVQGIGDGIYDFSQFFGSDKLQGLLMMDNVNKYPDDPNQDFLGTNSTLEVFGQENGHRWLSFVKAEVDAVTTTELLGRDLSHWSFYMDSDASVMEGNDIQDNGNGTFTTVEATETYSRLDRYIMGFLGKSGVRPFFFVRGTGPDPGAAPAIGVTLTGTRVNVTVNDVIQAEGPRIPPVGTSQKVFREAFIYFYDPAAGGPKAEDIAKVDLLRKQWQAFFRAKTGKGRLKTTLP